MCSISHHREIIDEFLSAIRIFYNELLMNNNTFYNEPYIKLAFSCKFSLFQLAFSCIQVISLLQTSFSSKRCLCAAEKKIHSAIFIIPSYIYCKNLLNIRIFYEKSYSILYTQIFLCYYSHITSSPLDRSQDGIRCKTGTDPPL